MSSAEVRGGKRPRLNEAPVSEAPAAGDPVGAPAEAPAPDSLTLGAAAILILGDGDLSFALALANHCRRNGLSPHIVATELGDPASLADRYFDSEHSKLAARLSALESLGVNVVLGVDSTALDSPEQQKRWVAGEWSGETVWSCGVTGFDLVIWNFPHTTRYMGCPSSMCGSRGRFTG